MVRTPLAALFGPQFFAHGSHWNNNKKGAGAQTVTDRYATVVRLTTPETQPGLPLSQVEPLSEIGAALSQQNVPGGRFGYSPAGT